MKRVFWKRRIGISNAAEKFNRAQTEEYPLGTGQKEVISHHGGVSFQG